MKVFLQNEDGFKPITLTITIETVEELRDLYARVNAGEASFNNYERKNWIKSDGCREIFNVLKGMVYR